MVSRVFASNLIHICLSVNDLGYFSVIDSKGRVYTWGDPSCGRLGQNVSLELDSHMTCKKPLWVHHLGTVTLSLLYISLLERCMFIGQNTSIRQVSCGEHHMLALTTQGTVFAWGDNRCAQLGLSSDSIRNKDSRRTDTGKNKDVGHDKLPKVLISEDLSAVMMSTPILIEELMSEVVVSVAAGGYHSLALTQSGMII